MYLFIYFTKSINELVNWAMGESGVSGGFGHRVLLQTAVLNTFSCRSSLRSATPHAQRCSRISGGRGDLSSVLRLAQGIER